MNWDELTVYKVLMNVAWFLVGIMIVVCQGYRRKARAAIAARKADTLVDLELATSEQLMKEIRSRNENPFILLTPVTGQDHHGINIEAHSIGAESSVRLLHVAATLTLREFRSRGMEIELPDLFIEGENNND